MKRASENENFKYWVFSVDILYTTARNFTQSLRSGDWNLEAMEKSIPLYFAFSKVNYARYSPLFQQDCLPLTTKFPKLYDCFIEGGFVGRKAINNNSGVPLDQALEQCYNKPAGGIIGCTRRKDAVAIWNLIKQDKDQYACELERQHNNHSNDSEYSLHHEFNKSSSLERSKDVSAIVSYINKVSNTLTNEYYIKVSNTLTNEY